MEKEKNCKNCKYFVQYYIKHKRYLIKAECGHCINARFLNKRPKEYKELREQCYYWESQIIKQEERKESIRQTLREMEKSLEDITLILLSDEQ